MSYDARLDKQERWEVALELVCNPHDSPPTSSRVVTLPAPPDATAFWKLICDEISSLNGSTGTYDRFFAGSALLLSGEVIVEEGSFTVKSTVPSESAGAVFAAVRRSAGGSVVASMERPTRTKTVISVWGGRADLQHFGIPSKEKVFRGGLPTESVKGNPEAIVASWRAALMVRGSVRCDRKEPAILVDCSTTMRALALCNAASHLGVQAAARMTRARLAVEVVGNDQGARLLKGLGLHRSSKAFAVLGSHGQVVHLQQANQMRAREAAARSLARVQWALGQLKGGSTPVPSHLRATGYLRIQYPEASLVELAGLSEEPISADVVAGRLRRLVAMAERCQRATTSAEGQGQLVWSG